MLIFAVGTHRTKPQNFNSAVRTTRGGNNNIKFDVLSFPNSFTLYVTGGYPWVFLRFSGVLDTPRYIVQRFLYKFIEFHHTLPSAKPFAM